MKYRGQNATQGDDDCPLTYQITLRLERFIMHAISTKTWMCPHKQKSVICGSGRVAQCNSPKSCRSGGISWVRIPSAAPYHPLPNGKGNSVAIISECRPHYRRSTPFLSLTRQYYFWAQRMYVLYRYKGYVASSSEMVNIFTRYEG